MADQGPWNDYAQPSAEQGPWSDYKPSPSPTPSPEPDMSAVKKYVTNNLKAAQSQQTEVGSDGSTPAPQPQQRPAHTMLENLEAGFQMSTGGLVARGKLPDLVPPEHADMAARILYGAGQLAGDVPAMLAGGIGGSAVAPVVGTAAGAFALPSALRTALIDHYKKGDIKDWGDFWSRAAGVSISALKGGTIGAVTAVTGGVAGAALEGMGAGALTTVAGVGASELAAMTTVGAAVEGHVPKAQDFADNAVMLLGLHGVGAVVGELPSTAKHIETKLQDIYAKTGIKPADVATQAVSDPVLKQEILSINPEFPPSIEHLIEKPQPGQEVFGPKEPEMVKAQIPPELAAEHPTLNGKEFGSQYDEKKVPKPNVPEGKGQSMTLYHGTSSEFENYDFSKSGGVQHFSEREADAEQYAMGRGGQRAKQTKENTYAVVQNPDGRRIVYEHSGDNIFKAIGDYDDSNGLGKSGIVPLSKPAESLHTDDINEMLETGEVSMIPKGARVIKKEFSNLNVLDATTSKGIKEISQIEAEHPIAKRLIGAAYDGYDGIPGSNFGHQYWNETKYSNHPARAEGLKEFHQALQDRGYDAIKFRDDRHTTISVFEPKVDEKATDGSLEEPSARDQILSRIGVQGEPEKGRGWDDVRTKVLDKLNPIKKLTDAIAGGEPLPKNQDPYAVIGTALSRGFDRAEMAVTKRPVDFHTGEETGVKGLSEILEPFNKDPDGFRAYGMAKRSLELFSRGIKTGYDTTPDREYVAENYKKYEKGFQEFVQWHNAGLKYLHDSGYFDKDVYRSMLESNKDYFPANKIQEDGSVAGRKGEGAPVHRIGDTFQAEHVDPIEQAVKNQFAFYRIAEQNRGKNSIVDLANKFDADGQLVTKIPKSIKPIEVSPKEISDHLASKGIELKDPEALTIFRGEAQPLGENQFSVMRDGKREVYETDPSVAKALSATDYQDPNLVLRTASIFAKTLRYGTTENPMFLATHFIRSEFTAFIQSNNGYIPFINGLHGLSDYFANPESWQNFLKDGGGQSTMMDFDEQYIKKDIWGLSKETGIFDKAFNVVKNPLEAMKGLAQAVFMAPKIAEYKNALKNGKDPFTAMYEARNVTVDVQKQGADSMVRAWSMVTPFFNMHLQGLDRMIQAFKEDPVRSATKVGLGISSLSIAAWMNGQRLAANGDDRYVNASRFDRDLFWIIPLGDKDTPPLKIPKPFVEGIMGGSLIERTLDEHFNKNPEAFKGFGSAVLGATIPHGIPPAILPSIEQFANKSWMTGNPIIPRSLEGVSPEYQYKPYTTETAKALGKMISYVPGLRDMGPDHAKLSSPLVIENYAREWAGQAGIYALELADKGIKAVSKSPPGPENEPPKMTLADNPFTRSFFARNASMSAPAVQDFYDNLEKTRTAFNDKKFLVEQRDPVALQSYMASPAAQENMVRLNTFEKSITTQNALIASVYKNPSFSASDKRHIIDGATYQIIQQAKVANQIMNSMREAIKARDEK